MSVMESIMEQQVSTSEEDLAARAFALGWAVSQEAHLPCLPEALAHLIGASAVLVEVRKYDGSTVQRGTYPQGDNGEKDYREEFEEDLGRQCRLKIAAEWRGETGVRQTERFMQAARLVHLALDCLLVKQGDREALGDPFSRLSDREWQVCVALDSAEGEKQIAETFDCSRHTLHSYVKSLYRKLRVQSRLQVVHQLQQARAQLRRQTLEGFAARCAGLMTPPNE